MPKSSKEFKVCDKRRFFARKKTRSSPSYTPNAAPSSCCCSNPPRAAGRSSSATMQKPIRNLQIRKFANREKVLLQSFVRKWRLQRTEAGSRDHRQRSSKRGHGNAQKLSFFPILNSKKTFSSNLIHFVRTFPLPAVKPRRLPLVGPGAGAACQHLLWDNLGILLLAGSKERLISVQIQFNSSKCC